MRKIAYAFGIFCATIAHSGDVEAILDITNSNGKITSLSNFIADDISIQLTEKNDVSLVERSQLNRILKEQGLQSNGAFDESTIAKIGKLLGATKIITGQYYQMGDDFQVVIKTIDVSTGKLVKAEKIKYPRSESTIKLDQEILINNSNSFNSEPKTNTTHKEMTTITGPVGSPSCHLYKGLIRAPGIKQRKAIRANASTAMMCYLPILSKTDGYIDVNNTETRFILDDGTKREISSILIANSENPHEKILANIPMQMIIKLGNNAYENLKKFNLFRFVYKFDGKMYEISNPVEFAIEDLP